jgi:hypothetical protein
VLTAPRDLINGLWQASLIATNNNDKKSECNHSDQIKNTRGTYISKHDSQKNTYCNNIQGYTNIKDAINYPQ